MMMLKILKRVQMVHPCLLITGGGQRIGAQIARYFAERHWEVIIHANQSIELAKQLAIDLRNQGGSAHVVQGDLCSMQGITQVMQDASQCVQRPIQVLINNAAIFKKDQLETLTEKNWDVQMEINAKAPVFLAQLFVRQLLGTNGQIIQILDQRVVRPTQYLLSYTVSQFALLGATHVLARSLAPQVRVNAVAPGLVLASNDGEENEWFTAQQQTLPLSIPPSGLHVAQAIDFLIQTPCITGHIIPIDSGESL